MDQEAQEGPLSRRPGYGITLCLDPEAGAKPFQSRNLNINYGGAAVVLSVFCFFNWFWPNRTAPARQMSRLFRTTFFFFWRSISTNINCAKAIKVI